PARSPDTLPAWPSLHRREHVRASPPRHSFLSCLSPGSGRYSQKERIVNYLRSFARREPILAVPLIAVLAGLAGWAATRRFGAALDGGELVAPGALAPGRDTVASREAVHAPGTVDRLQAEARAAGERAGLIDVNVAERS